MYSRTALYTMYVGTVHTSIHTYIMCFVFWLLVCYAVVMDVRAGRVCTYMYGVWMDVCMPVDIGWFSWYGTPPAMWVWIWLWL